MFSPPNLIGIKSVTSGKSIATALNVPSIYKYALSSVTTNLNLTFNFESNL